MKIPRLVLPHDRDEWLHAAEIGALACGALGLAFLDNQVAGVALAFSIMERRRSYWLEKSRNFYSCIAELNREMCNSLGKHLERLHQRWIIRGIALYHARGYIERNGFGSDQQERIKEIEDAIHYKGEAE
ncbi:MAG: hypothetical protein NVV63_12590 [Opitutus sp.]|nr:hypothetical protein [Opitutus sp.]